jgi:hypothetical protein
MYLRGNQQYFLKSTKRRLDNLGPGDYVFMHGYGTKTNVRIPNEMKHLPTGMRQ